MPRVSAKLNQKLGRSLGTATFALMQSSRSSQGVKSLVRTSLKPTHQLMMFRGFTPKATVEVFQD